MKHFLSYFLFLTLTISSYTLKCQNYQPVLIETGFFWNVCWADMPGTLCDTLFVAPDGTTGEYTVVNSKELICRITEDPNGEKLRINDLFGNNYVAMDMTLEKGDTFALLPGVLDATVDSVYFEEGRKIIRFDVWCEPYNEQVKFIEGIGPNISILYQLSYNIGYHMSCKHHGDTLVYATQNPLFKGCLPLYQSIKEPETTRMAWYDEATQSIRFQTPTLGILPGAYYRIMDMTGRQVRSGVLSGETLSLKSLPSGVYIVAISELNKKPFFVFKIKKYNK